MTKYVDGIQFVTEECCSCGMPFAMTADFRRRRLNDRKDWYCPRGHAQHYTGKSEAQKLRDQLSRTERRLEAESGRASLLEGQRDNLQRSYGRMRERVKNGVCPCCNRTFQNLLRHMRTKHPEFGQNNTLRALRDAYGLTQQALGEEVGIPGNYVSSFERDRYVPEHAKIAINEWVESQEREA